MDDEQYRRAKDALDRPVCVFEIGLQLDYFSCEHSTAIQMGERQALCCNHSNSHKRCRTFIGLALQNSGFAIGRSQSPAHLPFKQAVQVQIGSIKGLQALFDLCNYTSVNQILIQSEGKNTSLSEINFSKIVPSISSFSLPARRRSTIKKS